LFCLNVSSFKRIFLVSLKKCY